MSALACPHCKRVNDAHGRQPGDAPVNGDVSLCWGCGEPAVFVDVDGSLALRPPTAEEQASIEMDPEFRRVQTTVRAAASPSQALAVLWGAS